MIGDIPVGALVTRIEIDDEDIEKEKYNLHVMIILVLEPYRKLKIGSYLMDWIMRRIGDLPVPISKMNLHVLKSNRPAVEFYLRHNFKIV
jgi:ribosomal protein S18 acetylase RimI-like enzyme